MCMQNIYQMGFFWTTCRATCDKHRDPSGSYHRKEHCQLQTPALHARLLVRLVVLRLLPMTHSPAYMKKWMISWFPHQNTSFVLDASSTILFSCCCCCWCCNYLTPSLNLHYITNTGIHHLRDREIATTDEKFVKWTQWIFLQLFKKGLATQSEVTPPSLSRSVELSNASQSTWFFEDDPETQFIRQVSVNWCPALGTVLANEEVREKW